MVGVFRGFAMTKLGLSHGWIEKLEGLDLILPFVIDTGSQYI